MPLNQRLAMKWTAFFLLAIILHASASSLAQTLLTLTEKNTSLEKAFADIQKQSGYSIWYDNAALASARPVDFHVMDATLEQVMDLCCRDQPISYSIVGKMVVIKRKDSPQNAPSQAKDIKGKVTDEKGQPLSGATVSVLGKNRSVVTKENGEFEIKGLEENSTIVISHVGYESQEIKPGNKPFLLVQLRLSVSKLDDVQVIAYGTTTKRLTTGDADKLSAEDIEKQPISNPLAALEGHITGLTVTQATGVPGGAFQVQLRGQNSIANGNDPFYVIDGVPFTSVPIGSTLLNDGITAGGSPFSSIDPADIESIEVLKDADATSIYGSRGANGVILITTKKGHAGKTKIDINVNTGIEKVGHMLKLLNTGQYLQMRDEAFLNDGDTPQPYDYDVNGTWDTTRNTDWEKMLIGGTAHTTDVRFSVSGGDSSTQFLIGGGYHRETTVFPGDFADQKPSVHFSINNVTPNQRFKSSLSASYAEENSNLPANDLTTAAVGLPPDAPAVRDSTGALNWPPGFNNPIASLLQKYSSMASTLIGNAVLSYQVMKHLQLKASLGYNSMQQNEISTMPLISQNPSYNPQRSADYASGSFRSWIIEPQALWQSKLGKGSLNALIGTTFQQNNQTSQSFLATGFTSDDLLEDIGAATSITTSPYYPPISVDYKYQAVFGRINYNLQDKYIAQFTGRRDGSSRFGPGKQFADFGAIGLAWIFSKEKEVRNVLPFLSFGKFRISYGTTGNDQIGDYEYLSTYTPTIYPYMGSGGLMPTRLANSDYGWETNRKSEAGIDLGFLKDRILFSASYYLNRSSNQLVGYSLPRVTGFSSIQSNLPATVQNTGLEMTLNTINVRSSVFSWSSSINMTIPENKLISYPNLAGSAYAYQYVIGKSLQVYEAFHGQGVDPTTGIYVFDDVKNGGTTANPIYPDDLLAIKKTGRTYYGALQNSFKYKGWQLDFMVQFVGQNGFGYLAGGFDAPGTMGNQPSIVMSRWQKPGDITNIEQFTQNYSSAAFNSYFNAQYYGDNAIVDASFIRLKNLSLSWRIPDNILHKNHLQNFRLFVQGQNLFTITKYIGFDPENQDVNRLPPLRVIVAGFHITF